MSTRKRLPPEESRRAAVDAARTLLIEAGPQAVTLKAVAGRIGRTHANLLHHFGSAAGLQHALAEHLAGTVCEDIAEAARAIRAGVGSAREIVDLSFNAFGEQGGGALVSWMLLSGNDNAINPIIEAIHDLVNELHPDENKAGSPQTMHEATLALTLMAMGDALMGDMLATSIGVRRNAAREQAEAMLVAAYVKAGLVKA
jgi:AcrR family transcriptional regulator